MTERGELTPAKPRKRPLLWQSYLYWNELVELRKRHTLRVSASERGVSNLDAGFETAVMEHMAMDKLIADAKKMMVGYGETLCGETWAWLTSIRGLGEGGLAAQLLAQVDDVELCDTVSALWRFCGLAVFDGHTERNVKGEKAHFNKRLKSICWQIGDSFIKQQTAPYVELYYLAKTQLRALHPEPVKTPGNSWPTAYTDMHIHRMAMRKMEKVFLQHLWVVWRTNEGLPTSEPYVQAILGHTHILQPTIT